MLDVSALYAATCGRYYLSAPYRFILSKTAAIMTLIQIIKAIESSCRTLEKNNFICSRCRVNKNDSVGYSFFFFSFLDTFIYSSERLGTEEGVGRTPNQTIPRGRSTIDKLYGTRAFRSRLFERSQWLHNYRLYSNQLCRCCSNKFNI